MKYKKNLILFRISFFLKGLRIEKVLSIYLYQFSLYDIKNFIKNKFLFINDILIKKNIFVIINFFVKINLINLINIFKLNYIKLYIPIIYEDKFFIIINKPPTIVIHPHPNNWNYTLINSLLYYYGKKILNIFRLGILHRLDKNTTGLVIIAKLYKVYIDLIKQMKYNIINRYYFAIIFGVIRFSGKINSYIDFFYNEKKLKLNFFKIKNISLSKTNFILIDKFKWNDFYISSIKCNLETGRTHQIRIHLNCLNNPILGDDIYNKLKINKFIINNYLNRQALHSYSLSFFHPIFRNNRIFSIPLYFDIFNFYRIIYFKNF